MCEDVLKDYRNSGFNEEQLKEIYKGLLNGLDVEQFSKPGLSVSEMKAVRRELKLEKIRECKLSRSLQAI